MLNKTYFHSFQILRAVAFLTIFFSHCTIVDSSFSRWGVTVFFVLSGFLNAFHGYSTDMNCTFSSCYKYAITKISKLYPLHVLMVFVAFFLYTISTFESFQQSFFKNTIISFFCLLTNILLVSNWFPKEGTLGVFFQEYNIVTWYLSTIILFYFLTPFLLKLIRHHTKTPGLSSIRKLFFATSVLYLFIIVENFAFVKIFGSTKTWYIYKNPASRIGDYLIGMLLGVIVVLRNQNMYGKKQQLLTTLKLWISIFISIIQLFICSTSIPSNLLWVISSGFFFTIPVSGIITGLAESENYSIDFPAKKLISISLGKLGMLSPYTYLVHVPVINFVHGVYKRISSVDVLVWATVSFIVTMIIAIVFQSIWRSYNTKNG